MPGSETIPTSPLSHHLPLKESHSTGIVAINFHHSWTAILTPLPSRLHPRCHLWLPSWWLAASPLRPSWSSAPSSPSAWGCWTWKAPRNNARGTRGSSASLRGGHVDATDATGDGGGGWMDDFNVKKCGFHQPWWGLMLMYPGKLERRCKNAEKHCDGMWIGN